MSITYIFLKKIDMERSKKHIILFSLERRTFRFAFKNMDLKQTLRSVSHSFQGSLPPETALAITLDLSNDECKVPEEEQKHDDLKQMLRSVSHSFQGSLHPEQALEFALALSVKDGCKVSEEEQKHDDRAPPSVPSSVPSSSEAGAKQWTCPDCTFNNSALLPHCEMCGVIK